MVTEKELDGILKFPVWRKITTSKIPTWVMKDGLEGVEIFEGKIRTFWLKKDSPDRIYGEPASEGVSQIYQAFNEQKAMAAIDEKPEIIPGSLINSIPDILEEKRIITPADIEEWKKLSTFDRILLFQKTNKNLTRKRRGFLLPGSAGKPKNELTDKDYKMFVFVPADTMKLSANIAFLFKWSAVVEETHWFPEEVAVRGHIEVEIDGKMYVRPCGGSCVKKGIMDWGDTLEGAISEMLKRGIYHFLHGDVKRGDELE